MRTSSTQEDVSVPLIRSWTCEIDRMRRSPARRVRGCRFFDAGPFGGGQGPNCGSAWVGGEQVERLSENVGFFQGKVQGQGLLRLQVIFLHMMSWLAIFGLGPRPLDRSARLCFVRCVNRQRQNRACCTRSVSAISSTRSVSPRLGLPGRGSRLAETVRAGWRAGATRRSGRCEARSR